MLDYVVHMKGIGVGKMGQIHHIQTQTGRHTDSTADLVEVGSAAVDSNHPAVEAWIYLNTVRITKLVTQKYRYKI